MPDASSRHTFPAGHVLQLVRIAKRWDISAETLLAPFGLDVPTLEQAGARVPADLLNAITARTRELTGEPGLGVYLGLEKHAASYGFVGFAAMSASTMGEALEQAVEFAPAVSTAVGLSLTVEGETAALVVHEYMDLGPVRDVALFSLFVGFKQMTEDLSGRTFRGRVELQFPRPAYFDRFEDVLPGTRFSQPLSRLVFPASGLKAPLKRPDRAALNLAREQCQAQLQQLGFYGSLPGQVRRALQLQDGAQGLEQVARALGLSERTLKRRLADHGVNFSDLLTEERKLRAMQLLYQSDLSLDDVASRLGYASASSFARAFQRWTGQSPAAYRRDLARRDLVQPGGSPDNT